YGRAIRRGGAAGGDPGVRPRADAVTTAATAAATAITTEGTAAAGGMRTQRTGTRGIRERRGPGGPGDLAAACHDHPGRRAAGAAFAGAAAAPPAGDRRREHPGPPTRPGPDLRGIRRRFRVRLGF